MQAEFSPQELERVFSILEKIRSTLGFKHKTWAQVLGLSSSDYSDVYLAKDSNFKFHYLFNAAAFCGLTPEHILGASEIDFIALRNRVFGDGLYIPEKYTTAAFSKRRSAVAILDHVTKTMGHVPGTLALRDMQVQLQALHDQDATINIDFIVDLIQKLRTLGFPIEAVPQFGVRSVELFKESVLGTRLRQCQSIPAVYEHMVLDFVNHYESNCTYSLKKLTDDGCVVEAIPQQSVIELLKKHRIGSEDICSMRQGILQATPFYINKLNAKVIEASCIHRGDSVCRFEVDFSQSDYAGIPRSKPTLVFDSTLTMFSQ